VGVRLLGLPCRANRPKHGVGRGATEKGRTMTALATLDVRAADVALLAAG
jgi:hypothetical protein